MISHVRVVSLTCGQAVWFGGSFLVRRRLRGINEGVTDGAHDYPVLLHFGPQAVKESLGSVLGCGV